MPYDQIEKLKKSMVEEENAIMMNCQRISWYMRGGVSVVDALNMSSRDIDNIHKIIEDNMETTKKSKMPFF